MITEFAYQLIKEMTKSFGWADKWAGIVVPIKKMVNKTEKVIPVAINSAYITNNSDYIDLVPNSSRASIMYCERIGSPQVIREGKNNSIVQDRLRIVVWYNLNMINVGEWVDEGIMQTNVVNAIPRRFPNTDLTYIKNVAIFNPVIVRGADIFSKYSYDEVKTQFMTFPYGAFAIDMDIQYTHVKCATTMLAVPNCSAPYVTLECVPTPV
jgi:hypothetical protein